MTVVLETNEVTKRFGGLVAVNAVSMRVRQGEIVGLIGPNGAGKTTLLNAIAGLNPPTSGTVRMFDEDTTGLPPEKMCRRGLSRTFQIPRPFPKMSVLENIMTAATFGNRKKPSDIIGHCRELMEFVEFPLAETVISENLTTVHQQRLDHPGFRRGGP